MQDDNIEIYDYVFNLQKFPDAMSQVPYMKSGYLKRKNSLL
jgi:hypothetical protein